MYFGVAGRYLVGTVGLEVGESGLTTHAVMSWQCALEIKNLTYCAVQQARYFDAWAGSPHSLWTTARALDGKTRHGTWVRTRTGAAGCRCRCHCRAVCCVLSMFHCESVRYFCEPADGLHSVRCASGSEVQNGKIGPRSTSEHVERQGALGPRRGRGTLVCMQAGQRLISARQAGSLFVSSALCRIAN